MKGAIAIILVLSGCGLYFESKGPTSSDPDVIPDSGPHCPPLGIDAGDCFCASSQWRCTTCPADFRDETATCNPGSTCTYETWEHGCACACTAEGKWDCAGETIGSMCPMNPPPGGLDAGVN